MPGARGDPPLGPALGEVNGDERRAEVVRDDVTTHFVVLEELRAVDVRELQVRAQVISEVLNAHRLVVGALAREHVPLGGAAPAPGLEGALHATVHHPRIARVVGLVAIEDDAAVSEVEILPLEVRGLFLAHALAIEERVQHAELQRHELGAE